MHTNFSSFSLHASLLNNIEKLGYSAPTPIQDQAIPIALKGRDMVGLAQTGTGKTAAFVLPILQQLLTTQKRGVRALILAPTRELAEQILKSVRDLSQGTGIRSVAIYGGMSMRPQVDALRRGIDVVVACPGRLLDHLQQRTIDLSAVEIVVLDEGDQMFDMGFLPTVRQILKRLPSNRQSMLFSATMPSDIKQLVSQMLREPMTIQVSFAQPLETISHGILPVTQDQKTSRLIDYLHSAEAQSVLVFTRTKHRAKRLAQQLSQRGFRTASLQGNLSQNRRQEAIEGFRKQKYQILVATDIAARGIDIASVSHVVNYDMPGTVDAYTHRIGRTGRATRTGSALTFVTPEDRQMIRSIERTLGSRLQINSQFGQAALN